MGHRLRSTPTNRHRFTVLGLPWRSPIQVLTEVYVASTWWPWSEIPALLIIWMFLIGMWTSVAIMSKCRASCQFGYMLNETVLRLNGRWMSSTVEPSSVANWLLKFNLNLCLENYTYLFNKSYWWEILVEINLFTCIEACIDQLVHQREEQQWFSS